MFRLFKSDHQNNELVKVNYLNGFVITKCCYSDTHCTLFLYFVWRGHFFVYFSVQNYLKSWEGGWRPGKAVLLLLELRDGGWELCLGGGWGELYDEDLLSEATRASGGGWPGKIGWLDLSSTACLIPDLEDPDPLARDSCGEEIEYDEEECRLFDDELCLDSALWGSGMMTKPEPFDELDFHGVELGVWGGVRIEVLLLKLSRGVIEISTLPPPRTAIADSRMLRLARACWCKWFLLEAAACTRDGGRFIFWYWEFIWASWAAWACRSWWCSSKWGVPAAAAV